MHSIEPANTSLPTTSGAAQVVIPRQAETDSELIELWLNGRSKHTQRAYRGDAERFLAMVRKPLHQIVLRDLQEFSSSLAQSDFRPASRHRILSSVKSLFAYGHRLGYLHFDVARVLRLPGLRNDLSARMLDEGEVQKMLALEPVPRNHVLLTLLYAAGVRVSELCCLCWSDLQNREEGGGQITIFGKGEKTRVILLPSSVWVKLVSLRKDLAEDDPVFLSRKHGRLDPSQIWKIVRRAAVRAGIEKAVSVHWFRHAHASHALDRGAPISLVQATLGHSSVATTGRYLHARPSDSSAKYLAV